MYQIHRTANTVIKASTLSWRHWERGYSSSGRACLHSLLRSEPTRKHCHSCSLKYESGSPSDWAEKCSCDAPQCPRWDKLEFFSIWHRPTWGSLCSMSQPLQTQLLEMQWHQAMGRICWLIQKERTGQAGCSQWSPHLF